MLDHRYTPMSSTCDVTRKSPVGDMLSDDAALSTRKQSTSLKNNKKGKVVLFNDITKSLIFCCKTFYPFHNES